MKSETFMQQLTVGYRAGTSTLYLYSRAIWITSMIPVVETY
jgi:hypothetical protein